MIIIIIFIVILLLIWSNNKSSSNRIDYALNNFSTYKEFQNYLGPPAKKSFHSYGFKVKYQAFTGYIWLAFDHNGNYLRIVTTTLHS